jgi:diketogulonate reductase-like aldo/keto reductase
MIELHNISNIGIGTWGIGGYFTSLPSNDNVSQINAMTHALNSGINYAETVFSYAGGEASKLLANAISLSHKKRDQLFITLSIYHWDTDTTEDVVKKTERFFSLYQSTYIDNLQFTLPLIIKLGFTKTRDLITSLVANKSIRYAGIINTNITGLKKFYTLIPDILRFQETCYNFEIRPKSVQKSILWSNQHNIRTISYQPLRRNRTAQRNWPILVELAKKYRKTQNQILINWQISQGFLPIIKSATISHIDENIDATSFTMDTSDIDKITAFRVPRYTYPKIDWHESRQGISLPMLPDMFDQDYKMKISHNKS